MTHADFAEKSTIQATFAHPTDEERFSDDWTEDWTDDDYSSVISSDESDCSVAAPPVSPIAKDSDDELCK